MTLVDSSVWIDYLLDAPRAAGDVLAMQLRGPEPDHLG